MTLAAFVAAQAQENNVRRLPKIDDKSVQEDYSENKTGFWIATEIGGAYSLRISNPNFGYGELDVTAGYRFNEYLRLGLGLGARTYIDNSAVRVKKSSWALPVFANVRGNFIPTQYRTTVPYYSVDLGGTAPDGFLFRPSVGLRIGQERQAFLISVGYVCQQMTVLTPHKYWDEMRKTTLSFLSIRLGYEF